MDDLIRRSDAENIFRSARRAMKPENYSGQEFFIRDNILLNAEQIVHSIPAVDAVEVVRCKDCVCYPKEYAADTWNFCSGTADDMKPDDFCSYGQRREDGDA